jgi:hypothetical protein
VSEKEESVLADAKRQILAGIRTIRDGLSQIAPYGKPLEQLGVLERLGEPSAAISVIRMKFRESLITTRKALALLKANGIESAEIDDLQASHAQQVMAILSFDPFALKQKLPEPLPEGMDALFPKPTPFLGFAACKDCGSPVVLVRVLQSVECSHCDAVCGTPTHWNLLNTPSVKLEEVSQ